MSSKTILVWFKNDLRLTDNETWFRACEQGDTVIPVYIFDPMQFQKHPLGFPRTCSFRSNFLIESVAALKNNLRLAGSDLLIKIGLPEFIIPELVGNLNVSDVYTSQEVTTEEVGILESIKQKLEANRVDVKEFWTSTLIHYEDIPWPIKRLPDMFTQFRKEVERESSVRPLFALPAVKNFPAMQTDPVPTLEQLGITPSITDARSVINYSGGEAAAQNRVKDYIWEKDLLRQYKETRNGLIGENYSSKFSAALAHGCISPKFIYKEVKKYESQRIKNDSTYWLIFELLWRDYFRFVARKFGSKIFQQKGIRDKSFPWKQDVQLFETWRLGQTGVDFIDANMRELLATGFMSNRGRQNVASYLTHDLKIDWRWGAAWFESQLIDYDPCSNWLNWAYVAGVGNDPREDRYFNIESQVRKYDPKGEYMNLWLRGSDSKIPG